MKRFILQATMLLHGLLVFSPTANSQQPTANRQPPIANSQPPIANSQQQDREVQALSFFK